MKMESVTSWLKGLRFGDFSLVILCGLIVYLFRAQDSYSVFPVWRKMSKFEHFSNGKFPTLDERLPSPIITDLESDGVNEILLITSDLHLSVMAIPDSLSDKTEGKFDPRVLPNVIIKASVSLPVNLSSWEETREWPIVMETGYLLPYKSLVQVRKQVIVIVLDNWRVLCFDHDLRLLWSQTLIDVIPPDYSVKSMAALITPISLKKNSQGLVIVGGSLTHRSHHQANLNRHSHSHVNQNGQSDWSHFSTFALSGQDGSIEWHHQPGDSNKPDTADKEEPYHWKLGLKKGYLHLGESPWIYFHKDLLQQLPHSWQHLKDTGMTLGNVKKHSIGQPTSQPPVTEAVVGALGGEHIMGYAYGGMRPHSPHEHIENANAIITHHQNGIEVLNLQTGQPLTRLHLTEGPAVYLDIDKDTVIEKVTFNLIDLDTRERICRVQAQSIMGKIKKKSFETTVCDAWRFFWGWTALEREDTIKHMSPLVIDRVAEKRSIFQHILGDHLKSAGRSWDIIVTTSSGTVTSLSPTGAIQWQVDTIGSWVNEANSAGVEPNGEHGQLFHTSFLPSMTEMSLKVFGRKDTLVLVGWRNIVLVDLKRGRVLGEHSIPCQPTDQLVVGDFDNDGLNDVILTCPKGYIGFSIEKKTNHVYTAVYGAGVFFGVLFITWCLMSDSEHEAID